jgi:hypothetical protein
MQEKMKSRSPEVRPGPDRGRGGEARPNVRKRPVPKISVENRSLNLRIVYPNTIFVVGVPEEVQSVAVGCIYRRSLGNHIISRSTAK